PLELFDSTGIAMLFKSDSLVIHCSVAMSLAGATSGNQAPSLVMPIGKTSYLSLSRWFITEIAELSETSCSLERPPKIRPTRSFLCVKSVSFLEFRFAPSVKDKQLRVPKVP